MTEKTDDLESQTDDETQTQQTQTDDTGGEHVSAKTADGEKPAGDGKKEPTLADIVSQSIEEANKPRRGRVPEEKSETPEQKAEREANENAEAEQNGQVRDAKTGQFRAMTPEEKAAKEAAAGGKKGDPINDPIPRDLKKETAERMTALIGTVKELSAVRDQHNELMGYINSTGSSPAEFGAALRYMRAVHSDDPKALESAYEMLQSELLGLAERLGKPLPEVNLLNRPEYKDLADKVRVGKLELQDAHALALARSKQNTETTRTTAARTQKEKADAEAAAVEGGKNDLNSLEDALIARDGDATYRAKAEIVFAALEHVFPTLRPDQWKAAFSNAYERLRMPAAPTSPPSLPQGGARPTPIRPKQPAGGGHQEPKSALDAVSQALAGL